jgi:phosphoribosylformylglycinamidine cyclo-ligase
MKKKFVRAQTEHAYKQAGVNLTASDAFSAFAGEIGVKSYNNSPFVNVQNWSGHFRGPRAFDFENLPTGSVQMASPDGIGTKTIIIAAAGNFDEAAPNLTEMVGMDNVRWGGISLVLVNVFETKTLGEEGSKTFNAQKEVFQGLGKVARDQKFVIFGGETAEMSACVSTEITDGDIAFNWCGVMLGKIHPTKLINGSTLAAKGQCVIALRDGLRSNGASLIRKYFRSKYGSRWWSVPEALPEIKEAAKPAACYTRFLSELNGWYGDRCYVHMHLISHLTGGGIEDKFAPLLFERGLSADLTKLYDPPAVVKNCVDRDEIDDKEAYHVFNGGQGALVVVDEDDADKLCKYAAQSGLEARVAGRIYKARKKQQVNITSKFTGKEFTLWS